MTTCIPVVIYNILSSSLAKKDWFTSTNPEYLSSDYRFQNIKKKLMKYISNGALMLLTEVSTSDYGVLLPFFTKNKYTVVHNPYGSISTGYIGCCIAFPTIMYELESVDIIRVGDSLSNNLVKKSNQTNKWSGLNLIFEYFTNLFFPIKQNKKTHDPWFESINKTNSLIFITLKDKAANKRFAAGVYHMPCHFTNECILYDHIVQTLQLAKSLAIKYNIPYILGIDSNFKPNSNHYKLITNGGDATNKITQSLAYDTKLNTVVSKQLRSAYYIATGSEPVCTSYAQIKDQLEPCISTTDYIFISDEFSVNTNSEYTIQLPKSPLPNRTEPSDHLPVCVELLL